jgi:hypothetical protein
VLRLGLNADEMAVEEFSLEGAEWIGIFPPT